ncbi:Pyridoxal 5'-phosphate synthase subunit PdxT [Candidatus Burarchaeum australiense]|nr:Pyridoxal 5'-phosphate synthase subunit PdxT [Candidatus Burarchaeum australiense]
MRVGVLALQGDVEEHLAMLQKCGAEAVRVRHMKDVDAVSALIIPGGESTTIGKLIHESGIADVVKKRVVKEQFPVWGTCAGLVLMAKKGDGQVKKTGQQLLGLMDFEVERNAFGRQRESFEAEVEMDGVRNFQAYFIRAPAITKVWGGCKVLARFDGKIVAAEEGSLLATAFHPEIGGDARVHEYFLAKIKK